MSSPDISCRICNESFGSEESLNEHMAEEHPEQGMA
ncbi:MULTISPECIES: C2H2-type zinc finger protein [Halococcus]|nr:MULTISPECIES: C2H2-type zinc finger protein [Halococcus]